MAEVQQADVRRRTLVRASPMCLYDMGSLGERHASPCHWRNDAVTGIELNIGLINNIVALNHDDGSFFDMENLGASTYSKAQISRYGSPRRFLGPSQPLTPGHKPIQHFFLAGAVEVDGEFVSFS